VDKNTKDDDETEIHKEKKHDNISHDETFD
jgi:hypothetical protein